MALSCDGWYTLLCKRIKDEQSVEQDVPFSLISALREGYFNDGVIKSSEGHQVHIFCILKQLKKFNFQFLPKKKKK